MIEDEMIGWYHKLKGHEFEQTLGNSEGQGNLLWYSPLGHRELNMTEQLNDIKFTLPCREKRDD